MGLEEGTNEEESESEKVAEIFRELLEGVPVRLGTVERLGKKGDKVRHIRVTIEDQYTRRKILARAKNLKDKSATKKLFIVPDLTRLQQENDKKLRDKLRTLKAEGIQNVKIQKGEIIKTDGNEREVLFRIEQWLEEENETENIRKQQQEGKDNNKDLDRLKRLGDNCEENHCKNGINVLKLKCIYTNTRSIMNNNKREELNSILIREDTV